MSILRRTVLKWLGAAVPLSFLPNAIAARTDDIRHILPTVTDTTFSISVSVDQPRNKLQLSIGGKEVSGRKMDSKGRFWSFYANGLTSSKTYDLQLSDKDGSLGESWPLRTFPDRDIEPDEVLATREVNGFTIFEFDGPKARVRLFDCGGYDRSKGEDGRVQRVDEIVI